MLNLLLFFLLHMSTNISASNFSCSSSAQKPCTYDEIRDVHICDDSSFCLFDESVDGLCCSIFDIILNPSYFDENSEDCSDKINPRTGHSDCLRNAYLCYNKMYFDFMTQECPKTCRRCSETRNTVQTVAQITVNGKCEDKANPRTGLTDCPANIALCNNTYYEELMQEECPKTCGLC